MGRRQRQTAVIPTTSPPTLPPQRRSGVNLWVILADADVAAAEIEAGQHEQDLEMLDHIARSQEIVTVRNATKARLALLRGR